MVVHAASSPLTVLSYYDNSFRRNRTTAGSHPPPLCVFHFQLHHSSSGPSTLASAMLTEKTMVGSAGNGIEVSEREGDSGNKDMASEIMDTVRAMENLLPDSRTPLAILGHPANSPTASRTSENTCDVDGSREARTTEADRADVRDKDETRLGEEDDQ